MITVRDPAAKQALEFEYLKEGKSVRIEKWISSDKIEYAIYRIGVGVTVEEIIKLMSRHKRLIRQFDG